MRGRLALVIGCACSTVAPILAAGCAPVGHDYARPEMPVPAQYRFVEPEQANALADVRWWQLFKDEALQALIREAIANNLDLRAAVARVERARALAGVARSFLYPQVNGTADYTVRQHTGSDSDGPSIDWESICLAPRFHREGGYERSATRDNTRAIIRISGSQNMAGSTKEYALE